MARGAESREAICSLLATHYALLRESDIKRILEQGGEFLAVAGEGADGGGGGGVLSSMVFMFIQMASCRIRADTRSIRVTETMMMSSTAAVCAYSKPRITSCRMTPMPPAPTMPSTEAERTFDSKR